MNSEKKTSQRSIVLSNVLTGMCYTLPCTMHMVVISSIRALRPVQINKMPADCRTVELLYSYTTGLTLKVTGGSILTPQHFFSIFFTVFIKNMVRNLLTFTFFTFLQEITKKQPKKILWGGRCDGFVDRK